MRSATRRLPRIDIHVYRFLVVVAIIAISFGCGDPGPDRHGVSDSTLVVVLTELHLSEADGQIQALMPQADTLGQIQHVEERDSILAAHGLTDESFEASMEYFIRHPDEYLQLYNRVLDRLNRMESDLVYTDTE